MTGNGVEIGKVIDFTNSDPLMVRLSEPGFSCVWGYISNKELIMKNILVFLISVFVSNSVFGGTVSPYGIINKVRVVSSSHPTQSEYEAVFTLTPAQPHCTWIKLAPDSDAYISMVLFAKAQKTNVQVWYDSVSCQTITIEID